jgi:hypothetical protein
MSKKKKIDFSDEEAVLAEVAHDLEVDIEEVTIEEDSGLSSFGTGTVYRIGEGRREYMVVEDSDQMRALALAVVKQDLDQEPEIFTQSWLEGHIDTDRLRSDLESDVLNNNIDSLNEMDPDDFWREYERQGFEAPEENEDGERPEPDQSEIGELAEKQTDEELRDPMAYLEDIYGKDAVKQAIEIAGIDINAAAEDAVDTDGAEHFLAHYDGNSYETKSGLVYWRTN